MVQVGRRTGQAGRQSVRDRDRQGVDGSAVDHDRRARRNPRSGGRRGAGRRHRRRDRGRLGLRSRVDRRTKPAAAPATKPAAPARAGSDRCSHAGCPRAADYAPDQARSVLRSAHARPQFRPGAAVRRRHGHAAGAPACRRGRHRSFAPARLRPARPHRRARHRNRAAAGARAADRARGRSERRRDQGAVMRPTATKKCRSTACAAPSRRG